MAVHAIYAILKEILKIFLRGMSVYYPCSPAGSGGYFEEDNLATGHYKFKVKVKDRSTGMKATVKASFKVATDEGFCNVIPINGVEVSGNDATIEWASTGDPSIFSCSLDRGARSNCKI